MKTRRSKRKVLPESSEEIDSSDKEPAKSRRSTSDSMYSTEDSNTSRVDAAGKSQEDDFSQMKTKSSKRSKRARRPPNVSSDDEDASQDRLRKPSDSQYSSDDAVTSPKKRTTLKRQITSSAEESEGSEIPTRSTRARKKKKSSRRVASDTSEDDGSSQEKSGGSQTEVVSDSSDSSRSNVSASQARPGSSQESEASVVSVTTDEADDFIQTESDSSQTGKSNEPSQASEEEGSPKKYKNLRCGSDSDSDEGGKKASLEKESPKKVRRNTAQLMFVYKQLNKIIWYAKADKVRDIISGNPCDRLDLPEFSDMLWKLVTKNVDAETIKMLVRNGVDVNADGPAEYSNNTVLHVVAEKASRKGYESLAYELMSNGADINSCNGEGKTVLHSAVQGGSVGIVEELMRRNVELGEDYKKILQLAAKISCNSAKILSLLVEYKAVDWHEKTVRAMHALRSLVEEGNDLDAMKVLLDLILPLDEVDDNGQTLLHRAVINSRTEMVKLLLEYGANPRKARRDGTIPLWHASLLQTSEIAGLLIKHGASVHDCNTNDGYYPIHKACNAMSTENIKLFLYLGANVNVTDSYNNWTPFAIVNKYDLNDANKVMIQHLALLTSRNIKINARDLQKIRDYPVMRKHYAQCLCELEKMKTMIIFEDISVHKILTYGVEKISHIIKNSELIDKYHENLKNINEKYPIYSSVIRKRMKIAWWRRDKLDSIENALKEASNSVLTPDVCEKIAYFACYESFIDYDLKEVPF